MIFTQYGPLAAWVLTAMILLALVTFVGGAFGPERFVGVCFDTCALTSAATMAVIISAAALNIGAH